MKTENHDLAIIGAGPAGLSAAIYAARYKIDFILLGSVVGGTMNEAFDVENFPGVEGKPGAKISETMTKQLKKFGHEAIAENVRKIEKNELGFKIMTDLREIQAKKILLAVGMKHNKLGVPGEEDLCGKGVSYCATCDGFFFRNKTVAIIGGGNAAATSALYLAGIAEKVYLIVRKPEMRAEPAWQEQIRKNEKIEVIYEANLTEIVGTDKVEKIIVDKDNREIELDGVFIEIGQTPQTVLLTELGLKTDEQGYVTVDGAQKTSVEGVWAAGDLTTNSNKLRQIITACSEGAVATVDIFTSLKRER